MPRDAEFTVGSVDRFNARNAVAQNVRQFAEQLAAEVAADTPNGPSGDLRNGWRTERGSSDPASVFLGNVVPYWRFVEFGTRRRAANPVLGRAMARWRGKAGWA